MRDDQIIQAVEDDIVALLVAAGIPDLVSVLPSTNSTDLVMRDSLGQLPAVGVMDISGTSLGNLGLGQKRKRVTIQHELAIAVVDESGSEPGRKTARKIMGYINKTLDNTLSTAILGRYQFLEWAWVEHPRIELQLLVVRYKADVILGNE